MSRAPISHNKLKKSLLCAILQILKQNRPLTRIFSNMADCSFDGNADMYGLGIRIGFYLQWFGTILASWIARSEVQGMRFSNSLFVSATFLALIVQVSQNALRPVEIYIVLLLMFGAYLYIVPLYIWRLVTWGRIRLDPSMFPRVKNSKIYSRLKFGLLVAVCGFQLWFWFRGVEDVAGAAEGCTEWGFLFTKIRLDGKPFRIVNEVLYSTLLTFCLGELGITIAKRLKWIKEPKHEELRCVLYCNSRACEKLLTGSSGKEKLKHQAIHSFVGLALAVMVTTATEFIILWNEIKGVESIASTGQTIPVILSAGMVGRVLYISTFEKGFATALDDKDNDIAEMDDFTELAASPPSILTIYVDSNRQDTNRHPITKIATCTIDTSNMHNIVSHEFVENVLEFPTSSFQKLTKAEEIGGTGIQGAIYLSWHHKNRVFRDMRFLISLTPHYDLIIGARSIQHENLLEEPCLIASNQEQLVGV